MDIVRRRPASLSIDVSIAVGVYLYDIGIHVSSTVIYIVHSYKYVQIVHRLWLATHTLTL